MRAALLLTILVAASFAACVAPVPPGVEAPGRFVVPGVLDAIFENLTLERPDGAALAMTLVRPSGDGPFPVVLSLSPYYHDDVATWSVNATGSGMYTRVLVANGYAVVQASVRGTGLSTGCFDIGGRREQEDAAALVDHLGTQPWSNGNVAMIGKSYVGTTPWEAAILKPKHLKAIVPVSGITDMYRYMFYNGTTLYPWGAHFLTYYSLDEDYGVDPLAALEAWEADTAPDPVLPLKNFTRELLDREDLEDSRGQRCAEVPALALQQYRSDVAPDHDAFWDEREYSAHFSEIEAAVFLVHGWQDWNVKPDHVARVWESIRSPKVAWLGQWYHDWPDVNRHERAWGRADWNETLVAFLDATLKGLDNGFFDRPPVETQDHRGTWRKELDWPPTGTETRILYLGDGSLDERAARATPVRFVGDPTRPPGPDAGEGSVAFVSEPLDANMRVAGIPRVDLRLTPRQAHGHVAVTLYNVSADGAWHPLVTGFLDLRYRASRDASLPVVPGEALDVRIEAFPGDWMFRRGESIGLVVSGEWPADVAASADRLASGDRERARDPLLEGWRNPWPIYPSPGATAYDLDPTGSALRLPVAPS